MTQYLCGLDAVQGSLTMELLPRNKQGQSIGMCLTINSLVKTIDEGHILQIDIRLTRYGTAAAAGAVAGAAIGALSGAPFGARCLFRSSAALSTCVFTKNAGPGAGATPPEGIVVLAAEKRISQVIVISLSGYLISK